MTNVTKNILATIGVSTLASGIFYAGYFTGVYATTKVRETLDGGEGEEFEEDEELDNDYCPSEGRHLISKKRGSLEIWTLLFCHHNYYLDNISIYL